MSLFFSILGFSSAALEVWSLSGTTGSPNTANDTETSPTNAQAGWSFNTDGTVDRIQDSTVHFADFSNYAPSPSADLWIRLTANAGDAHNGGGMVAGTWYKLIGAGGSTAVVTWNETGTGNYAGSVKVELSTDSGGSTIVATGYYGGDVTVEP